MAQKSLQESPTGIIRRMLRLAYIGLELTALVSAPAAAVYGYLAYEEARGSSQDQSMAARNTTELVRLSTQSLEQEEERLVLHRGMLVALNRMLPEAEQTRLGVQRLAGLIDRRLEAVRGEQSRRRQASLDPRSKEPVGRSTPSTIVASWWKTYGPDSKPSLEAKQIWKELGSH